jgi:ATP-binding cassette subfamily F protein 3
MSGGEKARCALALIAWQRPNLLVLDEPTNHLDMETREALTMALSSFEGALLLVSHDRHLLRAATDTLWLVHDGVVGNYEGDLDQYTALVLASRREARESAKESAREAGKNTGGGTSGAAASEAPVARLSREDKRAQAQEREKQAQVRRPLQQKLQKVERELEEANSELRQIDGRLADPDFYNAGETAEVAAVLKQRGLLGEKVGRLEAQWLHAQEALERAP